MKPFFSIIIPTLNEEKFIPKILDRLVKQKERNYELIVVDGSSEDKTKEVVLSYVSKLPIKFYQVDKRNVSFQRNYGAKKAKGSYLVFLDADSGINHFFTKTLEREIKKQKGLVFIPHTIPDKKDSETKIVFDFINFIVEVSQNTSKSFSTGGCIFVEKNFFKNLGGFDEKIFMAEDHNLIRKANSWGVKARCLKKIKVEFSLRRWKREGYLKMLYKSLIGIAYAFQKGKVDKKIFSYEMGGHLYINKTQKLTTRKIIKKYLKRVEKFFDELF